MGWNPFKSNVTTVAEKRDENSSSYGTRTPNVSEQYTGAFNTLRAGLLPTGLNSLQQTGADQINGMLQGGKRRAAVAGANSNLDALGKQIGAYASNPAPTVTARTGASFMDAYKDPYEREVIDAALADYDASSFQARAGMRAANAGAFANKRYGVAEGQFAGETTRGRGALSANLLSQGFNTRAQLGMADADRTLSADVTNLNAKQNADAQAISALQTQAGLTQQQVDNLMTSDGIDIELANSMFAAGSISQEQLRDIIAAAEAWNGYSYNENKKSDTSTLGVKGEFGLA